jgi:hypothetical protein
MTRILFGAVLGLLVTYPSLMAPVAAIASPCGEVMRPLVIPFALGIAARPLTRIFPGSRKKAAS